MVRKEIRTIYKYGGMNGSSSSAATASVVKPGGTAIMWDVNWSSRIIENGQDLHKLGRWSYITINGRGTSKLFIIKLYRCYKVQRSNTAGLNTSYMQQELLLQKTGRKQVHQDAALIDLGKFINKKKEEGNEILICIDANEAMDDKNSKIREFVSLETEIR